MDFLILALVLGIFTIKNKGNGEVLEFKVVSEVTCTVEVKQVVVNDLPVGNNLTLKKERAFFKIIDELGLK